MAFLSCPSGVDALIASHALTKNPIANTTPPITRAICNSEAFNNQFEVKTDNDQLAFYILTPHFMESVSRADELADGYTNMLFKDNRVDIAMNNYVDSFEVKRNIYTQNALDECRMLMRKDLDILLSIADEILTKDRLFNA